MYVLVAVMLLLLWNHELDAQRSSSPTLTFEEACAHLRLVSDALAAAEANLRSKGALQHGTDRLRLPDISIETRELRYQKSLALGPLQSTTADWRLRPALSVGVPFYTGGRIAAAQGAAEAAARQASAERDLVAHSLTVQLVQTYFGLQLAERAEGVRADVLAGLQQHVDQALALERQGFATKAQRLQAQVSRDQAERDHQKSVNDLSTARASLALLLHRNDPPVLVTGLFVITTSLGTPDDFQREAVVRHPQVARLTAVRDQADQSIRVQRAALVPQAYFFGQYDLYRHQALLTDSDWAFGIGIQYLLFTGNGRAEKVTAAHEQREEVSASLRDLVTQLRTAVTKSWNDLETSRRTFLLLESSIAQAEENVRLQELSFREGQATSLDVIDARLGLGRARIERAQAAYQFDCTLSQLLELSGQADRFPEYVRRADKVIEP